ncbi:hypothetical protein K438DRAFT_1769981 [Mycena galopus ATCC 62051]|nr:hypothetical protein K438DRAFT_1769981 [Mycena galopus ATCC 62051]
MDTRIDEGATDKLPPFWTTDVTRIEFFVRWICEPLALGLDLPPVPPVPEIPDRHITSDPLPAVVVLPRNCPAARRRPPTLPSRYTPLPRPSHRHHTPSLTHHSLAQMTEMVRRAAAVAPLALELLVRHEPIGARQNSCAMRYKRLRELSCTPCASLCASSTSSLLASSSADRPSATPLRWGGFGERSGGEGLEDACQGIQSYSPREQYSYGGKDEDTQNHEHVNCMRDAKGGFGFAFHGWKTGCHPFGGFAWRGEFVRVSRTAGMDDCGSSCRQATELERSAVHQIYKAGDSADRRVLEVGGIREDVGIVGPRGGKIQDIDLG